MGREPAAPPACGSAANQVNARHIIAIASAAPAAAVLLVLAACTTPSSRTPRSLPPTPPTQPQLHVHVVRRGWHIDIGIARTDAQAPLQSVVAEFPEARYLLFGFGDRRYLLHGGAWDAVAALWGDAGLILVTSTGAQKPEQVFGSENVIQVALTAQQMSELQSFIGSSLATRDGAIVRVPPGPHAVGSFNAFYESAQRYTAVHTCNTWAAEVLESAALPVDSSGVELASQLWRQVQRLEEPALPADRPVHASLPEIDAPIPVR